MLWKKEKQIKTHVEDYLAQAGECMASFKEAMDVYFASGLSERFEALVMQTSKLESAADAKRREIEDLMYGNALIPESRGDILGMLEAIDLPPNKAESVLYQIWLQNMEVAQEYRSEMVELVAANVCSFELLCKAGRRMFSDISQVMPIVDHISGKEAESDRLERSLIKSVFDSSMDKADMILLKELFLEIGSISDRSENAGDRLRIMAIKRQT